MGYELEGTRLIKIYLYRKSHSSDHIAAYNRRIFDD